MITVFTPSYNRKKELKNLYKSLLKQDTNDFEWLIVDDGSTCAFTSLAVIFSILSNSVGNTILFNIVCRVIIFIFII